MADSSDVVGFSCSLCNEIIPETFSVLCKHLRRKHQLRTRNSTKVNLISGQNGCEQKFEMFANFRYYLSVCERAKENRIERRLKWVA